MTRLLLVGAGFAHLEVLARFAREKPAGLAVTLVAADAMTPYAGMLPGVVAGHYAPADMLIDLAPLAARAGVELIIARVDGLDAARGRARLADGREREFDLAAINAGATARPAPEFALAPRHALTLKPAPAFLDNLATAEADLPDAARPRIAVIGAGIAGIEMILALAHRHSARAELLLVDRQGGTLASVPAAARERVHRALRQAGIALVTQLPTDRPVDIAVLATGAAAPSWLARTDLARDPDGFLAIGPTLASTGRDNVFATGDIATMTYAPRPHAGVFSVRQGPVLHENLIARAAGRPIATYAPQRDWLSLIATGERSAIATRNGLCLTGKPFWWLKDRLDRRFLARYR